MDQASRDAVAGTAGDAETGDRSGSDQGLARDLGLTDIVLFGVGGIVGAGIYAIIGGAAADLAQSSGPLAEIMQEKLGGAWATGIVAVALFATSKTILSNILGVSRLVYDAGRDTDHRWLNAMATLNSATGTPIRAVVVAAVAAMAFGVIGDLRIVAAISNIVILLVFLMVNVALLRIRKTGNERAPFHLPLSVGPYPVTTVLAVAGVASLLVLNIRAVLGGSA